MRSRFFSLAAGASFSVGCLVAIVCVVTTFTSEITRSFHYRGVAWEIGCRAGALFLDNQPQREIEIQQLADADFHAQVLRNEERESLIRAIDQAPYGEPYRTATEKLSAWDQSHAGMWPVLRLTPTSAAILYRVHLVWLGLLFALLPIGWLVMRIRARDTRIGRTFFTVGRAAFFAGYVVVIGTLLQSYRKPIDFFVYTADSAYSVKINRGSFAIGRPPVATREQIAAIAALVSQIRNSDIAWTIGPPPRDPRPRPGVSRRLLIWPDIAKESSTQNLSGAGDYSATVRACLRALHDPDRFQVAYVLLVADDHHLSQRLPNAKSQGGWNTEFLSFSPTELHLALTLEQQAASGLMTFTPRFAPDARAAIELQWHQRHDTFSLSISIWPILLPLFYIAIRFIYFARQARRRRHRNHCRTCGYNLTGNTTGICPECGVATSRQLITQGRQNAY